MLWRLMLTLSVEHVKAIYEKTVWIGFDGGRRGDDLVGATQAIF